MQILNNRIEESEINMSDNELQDILNQFHLLEKMYDFIRIVDPVNKKVLSRRNSAFAEEDTRCFDYFSKKNMCENCISIRAFCEDETFIKLEHTLDRLYIVTAVPINLDNRRVVIELLINTKNSILYSEKGLDNSSEVYALIDNMNQMALHDPLTGIFNRRYINEKLPVEIFNSKLSGMPISVIMTDIDHFKKINDSYGHLTGDEVLRKFTALLEKNVLEASGWVARFGGEEFLICLPGIEKKRATIFAEQVRKSIEETEITYNSVTVKITASFGSFTANPESDYSMNEMIDKADKKLYEAKRTGRNKVMSD